MKKPVLILGGGLAGLTVADSLRRQGVPVRLFEAGRQVAGFARSFRDAEGFTYDFGAHFVTNRLAAAVGISAQCWDVARYGETVVRRGRTYRYPFGLLRSPKFLFSALKSRMPLAHGKKPENAAEWFSAKYGAALAADVAIPLTEAWSGLPADQLSPAVGESIPGSIMETMLLTAARRLTGRVIAIGYTREVSASPHVWHVYPKGGLGPEKIGASIMIERSQHSKRRLLS